MLRRLAHALIAPALTVHALIAPAVIALALLPAPPAAAQTVLAALRANAWPLAAALAATDPDPLAPKLVTFIRLLNPGQADAGTLDRFIAANPAWPDQPILARRYAEALADEPDSGLAASLCRSRPPVAAAAALLRCAAAQALAGKPAEAARSASAAWVAGLSTPGEEAGFLARWGAVLTQADQLARFDRLEPVDPSAAQRQLARLDPVPRALAAARLALRQGAPDALATLATLSPAQHDDPDLLLAEARFLRRGHADQAAVALWRTALPAAEAAAASRAVFWSERQTLARQCLQNHDDTDAMALADDAALPTDQAVEADFLSGWIALQRLHDPARAQARFKALAQVSHAAITQARAYYWLGRATPDATAAHAAYAAAAAWPMTYYGQLAAGALGQSQAQRDATIAAQRDPVVTPAEQQAFARSEPARAAIILAGWQDPRRGADFLLQAAQPPASLATRSLVAGLALRLGLPEVAVQAARLAGRVGTVLPQAGWPRPLQPPDGPSPPALVLALMRQESSFDPRATSASGARGLMQLMPGTARQVAQTLHAPSGPLDDAAVNLPLGEAYLAGLLSRFGNVQPYAIAAYNAGPNRVAQWVDADARQPDAAALIDWIELIPFEETRNYVQRVLENETIYRTRG